MKTFLAELADTILKDFPDWENLTVVFPNKRASLYFRKALAENISTPRWSPTVVSIEEFISSFSERNEADKLSLIVRLYHAYKKIKYSDETLDRFYFWGEMLLRDFDELDKYLVPVEGLFRDLSNQKEVDQYFDYLTEEQKQFLKDFWHTIEFSTTESKAKFLELWQNLYPVYQEFQRSLLQDNLAYGGMIHREVAEKFTNNTPAIAGQLVFAGFNALTAAEEKIITWCVTNRQARMYWDEDAYYVNTTHREAGTFFRQYREHSVLSNTFSAQPKSLLARERKMRFLGVPQKAGQSKLLAQELTEYLKKDFVPDRTVVVLPDESLLLPVLYALPSSLESINVTMGFTLVNTPYYSFIDFLFELQLNKRDDEFYYRPVLALLNHPYVRARIGDDATGWRDFILKNNQVYLGPDFFKVPYDKDFRAPAPPAADSSAERLLSLIFKTIVPDKFLSNTLAIIEELASHNAVGGLMEKEFAFHFHRILSRVQELLESEPMELRMQQRMFAQLVRAEKVPFSGEPLKGLQVMGVLETRNLDFDHVIVLSLNEGLWPAAPRQSSYIPHNIRKAYGLPTAEHQDAMYAYLFYRLLQRAEKVDLYYNTEPDVLGTGEMSRYLYQLIYESKWPFDHHILFNSIEPNIIRPIVIPKTADVLQRLERFLGNPLTPSTLNTYLDCRLKFYFRHLIRIKEPDQIEEEADARVFGNILHKVMELFYLDIRPPVGPWHVRPDHFDNLEVKLERMIELAFRQHFRHPPTRTFNYTGQLIVVKEMVKTFARKVLLLDKKHAPFVIEMLEGNNFNTTMPVTQAGKQLKVVLGGKIDRVDRNADAVRILDYKTGRDENTFTDIPSLFIRDDDKRNKAAFQAVLYAWVYDRVHPDPSASVRLQPGLVNRKEIFKKDFEYGLVHGGDRLTDVRKFLPEFENHLKVLLEELFNPAQAFDQTTEVKACGFCAFKEICGR